MRAPLRLSRRIRPLRRPAGNFSWPAWMGRLPVRPLLAGLLGLVLLGECFFGGGNGTDLPPANLPSGDRMMASMDLQGWTQTILARPLFNASRRPDGEAGGKASGLPRLSAIIIEPGGGSAIFSADGQKPQVVRAGDMVDGNTVESITADAVVLITATGPLTLRPQFAKLSAGPGVASASPIPTPVPPAGGTAPPPSTVLPANLAPPAPPAQLSPKTGQPIESSFTAGPYDNE